ncbi:MFS transporter [Streptomyces zagrosensis]|uniref:Putative MFS family arabinose efflux permease n=1 Tax=Streptomyces zagrosensis TaxID=1042984 RepID=A0A7W9QGP1_9ACTN|nr:MFS transporter [Streptomyces zagrosensis]MBB5939771.1 putative MFS family arabinose efflux permease [Streptomyces zagrosensis]
MVDPAGTPAPSGASGTSSSAAAAKHLAAPAPPGSATEGAEAAAGTAGAEAAARAEAAAENARSPLRNWLAVGAVAIGIFSVVTTEMLPVGLLTSMSSALGVSDGTAGLAMTLPGIVAALSAPVLTVVVGRYDRKIVLCALMALLTAANLVTAIAPNFAVLLVARLLIGLTIGGIWPIAVGIAVRLVPERSVATATSIIFGGIAVGFVLGVPAGTFIGDLSTWRLPFVVMGLLTLAVLATMVISLPRLPATQTVRLTELPGLLRNVRLRTGLIITALLVTGHFAAYTYLRPVLEEVSEVPTGLISTLLLIYGAAGIVGNFAAGSRAYDDPRGTLMVLVALLAGSVLLIPLVGTTTVGAGVLLAVWGLAYGGVSVSAQAWVLRAAPEAGEVASALFISVFNASISLGALLGGRAADGIAVSSVLWCGGTLAMLALVTLCAAGAHTMPRRS